jgi:hypothetical protein
MRAVIGQFDRARLAKLLALVGSDHDGEALSAARAADRLVRRAGLSWTEALSVDDGLTADRSGVATEIAFCLRHPDRLTAWESRFLRSAAVWPVALSAAQRETVRVITDKARRAGRVAA